MKLIVGLGNPGNKYAKNLHNVGFMAIDALCDKENIVLNKSMFDGNFAKTTLFGKSVIIAKPQTYMNLSGSFIKRLAQYYKIENSDILILFDDMEIPFESIRLRQKGSSGGHNGIKSIIEHLGTESFARIKIGVNRPPQNIPVVNYVLSNFSDKQVEKLPNIFEMCSEAVVLFVRNDFQSAQVKFNKKVDKHE